MALRCFQQEGSPDGGPPYTTRRLTKSASYQWKGGEEHIERTRMFSRACHARSKSAHWPAEKWGGEGKGVVRRARTLWRVASYLGPGLPRPTSSQGPATESGPAEAEAAGARGLVGARSAPHSAVPPT